MRNEQTPKDLDQVKDEQEISTGQAAVDHVVNPKTGHDEAGAVSDVKPDDVTSGVKKIATYGVAEAVTYGVKEAATYGVKENVTNGMKENVAYCVADDVTGNKDGQNSSYNIVEAEPDQEDHYDIPDTELVQDYEDNDDAGKTAAGEESASAALKKDEDIVQTGRTYAGFFARLTAYLLDHLFLLIPAGLVRLIMFIVTAGNHNHILNQDIFFRFSPADMILYAIPALYFIILTYTTGRTLGKRIMRLKVVSTEERKPSFLEILFRETFGRFLSAFILCIGYLMIVIGDQKEALHDYLADTRVIYR